MATAVEVRQSYAARYDNCPLSAHLGDVHELHDTHPQARGTIAHEFARRLVATLLEKAAQVYPPDAARDLMAIVIAESGLPVPTAERDSLLALAWKFAAEHTFDTAAIVDLEQPYSMELGGVTITGRPDVVEIRDLEATIRDYKTSFAIDPQAAVEGTFQGRWYALLIFNAYPQLETVRVVISYVRWGETREAVFERWQLDGIAANVKVLLGQLAKSQADDHWPATPGSWCHICPAPQECPIPLGDRRDGAIDSPEMAQSFAEQLVTLDELRKRRTAALRAYCDQNAVEVAVGDEVFGFKDKAGSWRVIDRDALRAAMEAADLTWDAHFRWANGSTEFKARKAASQ